MSKIEFLLIAQSTVFSVYHKYLTRTHICGVSCIFPVVITIVSYSYISCTLLKANFMLINNLDLV